MQTRPKAAEEILRYAEGGLQRQSVDEMTPLVALYETYEKTKIAATLMQFAIIGGAGVATLATGGAGAPAAVEFAILGEKACETVKLGATIGQAITLAAAWAKGPYLTNTLTTASLVAYERAALALMGREHLLTPEILELDVPDYLLPWEVKLLKVKVHNTSNLPIQAMLRGVVSFDVFEALLPSTTITISVPIESQKPVEIPPGGIVTIEVPISYPSFLLYFGLIPTRGSISAHVDYGYFVPYGASVKLPEKSFELRRIFLNIIKNAEAFIKHKLGTMALQGSNKSVTFQVNLTVTNYDKVVRDVTVIDEIPENLNPTDVHFEVEPSSIDSGKFVWRLSLKPHEVRTLRYSFTTDAVEPGDVYYLPPAEAEVHSSLKSESETGRDLENAKSPSVMALVHNAALRIKDFTIAPIPPIVNHPFHLEAKIENVGTDPVRMAHVGLILPNGLTALGDIVKTIDTIDPGESVTVDWDVKAEKAGDFIVRSHFKTWVTGLSFRA